MKQKSIIFIVRFFFCSELKLHRTGPLFVDLIRIGHVKEVNQKLIKIMDCIYISWMPVRAIFKYNNFVTF